MLRATQRVLELQTLIGGNDPTGMWREPAAKLFLLLLLSQAGLLCSRVAFAPRALETRKSLSYYNLRRGVREAPAAASLGRKCHYRRRERSAPPQGRFRHFTPAQALQLAG